MHIIEHRCICIRYPPNRRLRIVSNCPNRNTCCYPPNRRLRIMYITNKYYPPHRWQGLASVNLFFVNFFQIFSIIKIDFKNMCYNIYRWLVGRLNRPHENTLLNIIIYQFIWLLNSEQVKHFP